MNIKELLNLAINKNASDLHLSTGLPARIRVDGDLQILEAPLLQDSAFLNDLYSLMTANQKVLFEKNLDLDFSFSFQQINVRAQIFTQSRGIGAVFRIIHQHIPSIEELGLPDVLKDLVSNPHGLVLFTGSTGSGKSTTLAAVIDYLNNTKLGHIVTIEDPIEFHHTSRKCLIHQRELHRDTSSFSAALHAVLREDPDYIIVGELRDLETIRLALTAAETGHLVFGTLHTNSAAKTINRIVDVFPAEEKSIIRTLLSESLRAVIAQNLIKKLGGGRVAVFEIMIANSAIANLIRENKIAQLHSVIQTNQKLGMNTFDQHLMRLVSQKIIDNQIAEDFKSMASNSP
jgi:twitching motility protein PilT